MACKHKSQLQNSQRGSLGLLHLAHIRLFPALLLALLIASCSEKDSSEGVNLPAVDADAAYTYVKEFTEIGPKIPGSEGSRKAQEYIAGKISKAGLTASQDRWKQVTPAGEKEFCNITADIAVGGETFVILGAHYDTKLMETVPDFAGANDGASGTGLLIAIMELLAKGEAKPNHGIRFAFFDGEECFINYSQSDGFFGSRRMAGKMKEDGSLKNCRAVIILDMVGDSGLTVTIPRNTDPGLAALLFAAAEKQGTGKYFSQSEKVINDDHGPFMDLGIPCLDIIDFSYGENNIYWHTKADTMDKISSQSLGTVGNATIGLLFSIK